jgi:hypothetical protein
MRKSFTSNLNLLTGYKGQKPSVFTFKVQFIAILFACSLLFAFDKVPDSGVLLEGKWECSSKTGRIDEFITYQLICKGNVVFKSDHSVESTTTDAFILSGTQWKIMKDHLLFLDSYDNPFIDYEIKILGNNRLVLLRNGIEYGFNRSK